MATKIKVDAYIRVSRIGDRAGDRFISPELQRESIERTAEREGLQVVEWFEELDASGGDKTRPMWNEAIERVERGTTRGIVCWNLSRFSRSLRDYINALDRIEDAGGKLYTEEGGTEFDRNIRAVIAEDERKRAKAGFRNAVANAIARGIHGGCRVPFGYVRDAETRKLVPDPHKAAIVRELFERRAKGQSWKQLSDWLWDIGVGTTNKEGEKVPLARVTIREMVFNSAYLGHARSGEFINEKAHAPIVSRRLWDSAQKAKGRKPAHTGASKNLLLRGLISCGTCGHGMVVGSTRGKVTKKGKTWQEARREKISTYTCRNLACRDHAYARAAETDEYVTSSLLAFFSEATLVSTKADPKELAQAEKDLEDAEYALDLFMKNKKAIVALGVDRWNAELEEYVAARDIAQATVEALRDENPSEDLNLVPDLWETWTNETRREWLVKFLADVTVTPAQGERGVPIQDRVSFTLKSNKGAPTFRVEGGGWALMDDAEGTFDVVTGAQAMVVREAL